MKESTCNVFFSVLSNKIRADIIDYLKTGPKSVKNISEKLNKEQSVISHNLKTLSNCNFVRVKRNGKRRIYSLNKKTIVPILKIAEKHIKMYCCKECSCT